MKKVLTSFALTVSLSMFGCAGMTPAPVQNIPLPNSKQISVIIPNDSAIVASKITQINCDGQYGGRKERQEKLFVKNKTANTFSIERRTDNGVAGSGVIYDLNYAIEKDSDKTIVKIQPTQYRTYQQGLIGSFEVPNFSEEDLANYIANQPVYYNLELASQYNTDSTYANFVRLAEKAPFKSGEKDPITGKIFKDKFALPYKTGKIFFTLETFPYRNGSKAVIHVVVPGNFTSESTVDYGIILKELKAQLEGIVNS
jgi:hypothetical protein